MGDGETMIRALSAPIQSVTGAPREGLRVDFLPGEEGYAQVSEKTDAGGVFVASLEVGVPYSTAFIGPIVIDGVEMPGSVTVIYLTVPEGEGTATLAESATLTLSTGWSVLLRRLVSLEQDRTAMLAAVDALTARVTALEGVE